MLSNIKHKVENLITQWNKVRLDEKERQRIQEGVAERNLVDHPEDSRKMGH